MAKSNVNRGKHNRYHRRRAKAEQAVSKDTQSPKQQNNNTVTSPTTSLTSSSQLSDENMYFDFETLGNSDEGVNKLFGRYIQIFDL